jgi:nicotinate-nucleotide--dimethylbenzimidazole phosphoribosyltransferase
MVQDFATIRRWLDDLPEADEECAVIARAREAELTKPAGALGRLEDIAVWAAAWQGVNPPRAGRIQALVFAGNHGVAAQGVSAYPPEVTVQMVANFAAGGAAINQLCRSVGADLSVHALDLERPTADFSRAAAMSEADCADAFFLGAEQVDGEADLLCLGEMGIGNTTAAAALGCALFGGEAALWVGPGTGVDAAGIARKIAVVEAAVEFHAEAAGEPLEVLRRLGGRELAAISGAVVAARRQRVPVLLDGYVCTAAAAPLHAARAGALDHCLAAHRSAEPAHGRLLVALDKAPLLDLGMRLGEASGAALAAHLVKAAIETHAGMATFAEASVSQREDE